MEGGCYCGAIRYKLDTEPVWAGACHCTDCRKLSGAPYTVWVGIPSESFKIIDGTPKDFRSSEKVIRSFCEVCGSPITYQYPEKPSWIYMTLGSLDSPEQIQLQKHIWVSQKLPRITLNDGLAQEE